MPPVNRISAADLTTMTPAAVRAVTADIQRKFKGPTMRYILQNDVAAANQLTLASQITDSVTLKAKGAEALTR